MWISSLLRRIEHLFRRDEFTADLNEEMGLHVELRARKLAAQGVPDAASAARRRFGNRGAIQDASAESWGWGAWERLFQDLRHAARTLAKTPGFTLVAIATLAIGLGINTAVYSVVNAVMVRRLPFTEPGRLISLWEETTGGNPTGFSSSGRPIGNAGTARRTTVSFANLEDYRKISGFVGAAAFSQTAMNLTGIGTPERLTGEMVTAEYLPLLGVSPALGRGFVRADEGLDANRVVIVSHNFWQRRMGGDPGVTGRSVLFDGRPYQVIGVMPAGFRSPTQLTIPDKVEFWVPPALPAIMLTSRGDHEVNVLCRLRAGMSLPAARAEVDAVSANLARAYPATNGPVRAAIAPLQDDLTRNVAESLPALLGASGLIVLIACVNVANLFLVRAIGRRHEISVRFAIGANRWRLIRQFLAESMVVAGAGCLAGILLGYGLKRVLVVLAPANLPMIHEAGWDWRVFAVASGIGTLTGALFGIAPAWQASQVKPAESLQKTARSTVAGAQARWRMALTVGEVALSLILLIGAGLLLKSFVLLAGVDLGFQAERVLAMNVALPDSSYGTPQQRLQFFERVEGRVRAIPGVQSVAYANRMPLRGGWGAGLVIDSAPETVLDSDCQAVSPGYFETLGIPLLRGRTTAEQDRDGQPSVAVVNQAFARQFLNGADPVGRHLKRSGAASWVEIVGVVNDIRRGGKTEGVKPQVYFSAAQTRLYPVRLADLAVRTAGDPRQLVNAVQAQVWALDKDQPVTNVRTLEEIVTASVSQRRFQTLLLAVFAAVAVGLAIIGIYGVLSYSVTQRTPELGIRMALGAPRASILALVLRQAGVVILAGVAVGLAGSWALTVYVESLLFQVARHDWRTYAAAVAALAVVSLVASWLPARRGSRVDPIVALRYE